MVVTRFECPNRVVLAYLLVLHTRIKRDVRRFADGLIGARTVVDWRRRTLLSVTLWTDIASVYGMGGVSRHVAAARIPSRLGVRTRCGVFCFAGDWRRVMFRSEVTAGSPFQAI